MSLSAKEEKFCQEFVKCLDKAKAARAAGYSKRSAKELGYETFTKPHIQQRIEEIRQELRVKLGVDEHSVLKELASLSFWNIRDFIGTDNAVKDLSKMQKGKLKPIAGIKTKQTSTTFDGVTTTEITTELKLSDKRAALNDLGRHLGIFEEDNKQSIIKINVTRK